MLKNWCCVIEKYIVILRPQILTLFSSEKGGFSALKNVSFLKYNILQRYLSETIFH